MSENHKWAKAFIDLANRIREMQEQAATLRAELKSMKPGYYDWGTIYTVRESRIRAHNRRAFVAVRVKSRYE